MKLLISILIFFTGISVLLAGGAAGLILLGEGTVAAWKANGTYPGFWGYMMLAALHMMLGTGLILSVVSAASGAVLCLLSFIFKSWMRALLAAGMCCASVAIWKFLLECGL